MTKHLDSMTRRSLLGGAAATGGMLMIPWLKRLGAKAQAGADPEEQKRIEAALPAKAFVTPRKPRRLLIFDLNVNYGGHASIPHVESGLHADGRQDRGFRNRDQP